MRPCVLPPGVIVGADRDQLGDRVEYVGADFFEMVPKGGDSHLPKHVTRPLTFVAWSKGRGTRDEGRGRTADGRWVPPVKLR